MEFKNNEFDPNIKFWMLELESLRHGSSQLKFADDGVILGKNDEGMRFLFWDRQHSICLNPRDDYFIFFDFWVFPDDVSGYLEHLSLSSSHA